MVFSQHLIRLGIGRKSVSYRILPLRNLYYRNIALENAVIWLACAAGEWYPAGKDRRATAGKTVGTFFHGAQSTPQISPNFVAHCCAVGYPSIHGATYLCCVIYRLTWNQEVAPLPADWRFYGCMLPNTTAQPPSQPILWGFPIGFRLWFLYRMMFQYVSIISILSYSKEV